MQELTSLLVLLRSHFPDVYPHALPQAHESLQRYALLRPTSSERIGRSNSYVQSVELTMVAPDYQVLSDMHQAMWPAFHFYGDRMRIDEDLLLESGLLARTYSFTLFVSLAA